MINRRAALVAIGAAAAGGIDWLLPRSIRPGQAGPFNNSFTAFGAELAQSAEESVNADLARVGAHTYSEEGIPMFLACINLGAKQNETTRAATPSPLNRKVGTAFQRYTGEWHRMHPNAPATDVAKIVEVLADQDFNMGGLEKSL